jgi:hypothetical protein
MGTQITKTGLVPKETDPKNWLSRYGKFSAQSGLADSSPAFSVMADPVPDLNVLPGPQRGATSISITPNAFTVFNDPVERTGDADSGAPVTGTKRSSGAPFPWWILIGLGVLWWISSDE